MSALLYGPRRVFLPAPVDAVLAAAIRAAGHTVESGSREAFERSDTVVVSAPMSAWGVFYAGAAFSARRLVLIYRERGHCAAPVVDAAQDIALSVPELIDLLRRWDPVARAFAPTATRPPRRYRHRVTGEVRQRAPSAIGGSLKLRVLDSAPYSSDVILRDGEHEAAGWELLGEGSDP